MLSLRKSSIPLILVALALPARGQDFAAEVDRIESAFVRAANIPIVNRISELPDDVLERFEQIVSWTRMADFGELWNTGDVVSGELPGSQHIFSGVSQDFVAIVYLEGGITGRSVRMLLAERHAPGACMYALGSSTGVPFILDYLRQAMQNRSLRRNGQVVTCSYLAEQ